MSATFGEYILDGVAIAYATFVLIIWINKEAVFSFFGEIMAALK